MTLFMQRGLKIPPLAAGLAFIPLALAFVIASRHSGVRAWHRGTKVLVEGCALQIAGLVALALRRVRHHGADRKCGRSGRNRCGVLRH